MCSCRVVGFGWLAPGELRLFEPSERDEALAWLGPTEST
jgi:hypothetical protein